MKVFPSSKLWSLIKENAAKFSAVHTKTSPITQKTCALIAIIELVNQKWHMPVDISTNLTIQVVCVKTAILQNTTKRLKEREMKRSNKKNFKKKAKRRIRRILLEKKEKDN